MRTLLLFLILSIGISSCENFLDVSPKGEILEKKLFVNGEGFEDALYGVYSELCKSNLYGENLSYLLADLMAQYYVVDGQRPFGKLSRFNYMDIDTRKFFDDVWKDAYRALSYTNNVLENIDAPDAPVLRYYNFYKGEALGLRGFLHLELCMAYAPAITRKPDYPAIPYSIYYLPRVMPFETVSNIYRLAIADLKSAEVLLENEGDYLTSTHEDVVGVSPFLTMRRFHMNLYAVQALLARTYWMKNDMDSAAIYAKKVIDSGRFTFTEKTKLANEFAGTMSSDETIWALYPPSGWGTVLKNIFTQNGTNPDRVLIPLDGIPEFANWFYSPHPNGVQTLYDVPVGSSSQNIEYRKNWFYFARDNKAYLTKLKGGDQPSNNNEAKRFAGINMIRISEMYLIMTEALFNQGRIEEARNYFDTYTFARGFKWEEVELTQELINKEYRKEFIGEGREWWNLKRQFHTFTNMAYQWGALQEATEEIYMWPIPDQEFEYRIGGKEEIYGTNHEDKPNSVE